MQRGWGVVSGKASPRNPDRSRRKDGHRARHARRRRRLRRRVRREAHAQPPRLAAHVLDRTPCLASSAVSAASCSAVTTSLPSTSTTSSPSIASRGALRDRLVAHDRRAHRRRVHVAHTTERDVKALPPPRRSVASAGEIQIPKTAADMRAERWFRRRRTLARYSSVTSG